jgi:hypothetical protein
MELHAGNTSEVQVLSPQGTMARLLFILDEQDNSQVRSGECVALNTCMQDACKNMKKLQHVSCTFPKVAFTPQKADSCAPETSHQCNLHVAQMAARSHQL